MATLDDVQSHILASSSTFVAGGSTGGTPVWLGGFPGSTSLPETAVAIYDTGGVAPLAGFSSTAPLVRQPGLQVLSRSTSYTTARANAQTIWSLFFATMNSTIGTERYLTISPQQDLIDLGTDQNHLHLISANYIIQKEPA